MLVMGAAVGHALFHPSAMDLVYRLSPPTKRGIYTSIFTTSGSISYSIGPFIAGSLIEFAGLPSVVWMVIPGILGATWIYRNDLRYMDEKVFEKSAKKVISQPVERKKILVDSCWAGCDNLFSPLLGIHGADYISASASNSRISGV